ncbi:hypothetical protein SESBI_13462 [Sesbania bispinosa]|nr:hypothetical protein SESBI_13462 [Sesbania bispinosa]
MSEFNQVLEEDEGGDGKGLLFDPHNEAQRTHDLAIQDSTEGPLKMGVFVTFVMK